MSKELYIFAEFRARAGSEELLARAIAEVLGPTSREGGCLSIGAFRAKNDVGRFFIHSRWRDEQAFEHHATLAHTERFIGAAQALVDHPLDVVRTYPLSNA